MRLVALLAIAAPASSLKLPWRRSVAAVRSDVSYELGLPQRAYMKYQNRKDGNPIKPAVSDAYDFGFRGKEQ